MPYCRRFSIAASTDLRLALRFSWSRTLRRSPASSSARRSLTCAVVRVLVADDRKRRPEPGRAPHAVDGAQCAITARRAAGDGADALDARARQAARLLGGTPDQALDLGQRVLRLPTPDLDEVAGQLLGVLARHAPALDGVVDGLLQALGGDHDALGQQLAQRRQRGGQLILARRIGARPRRRGRRRLRGPRLGPPSRAGGSAAAAGPRRRRLAPRGLARRRLAAGRSWLLGLRHRTLLPDRSPAAQT